MLDETTNVKKKCLVTCNGCGKEAETAVPNPFAIPDGWHVFRARSKPYPICSLECGETIEQQLKDGKMGQPKNPRLLAICICGFEAPVNDAKDWHDINLNGRIVTVHAIACVKPKPDLPAAAEAPALGDGGAGA